MIKVGWNLARLHGWTARAAYRAALPVTARRPVTPPRELPLDVVSFSSQHDLPEQVASIRSFLRHAGRPKSFTVVSDGTHSARGASLLRRLDPCVAVTDYRETMRPGLPGSVLALVDGMPLHRKFGLIVSMRVERPTLYADSDVLFFPGAQELATSRYLDGHTNFYLRDGIASLDERLLASPDERHEPVNSGVMLFNRDLDWKEPLARLEDLDGAPHKWTDQTLIHLALHASGARRLDPRRFVCRIDDYLGYSDEFAGPELVLRHYVSDVRNKMWAQVLP